MRGVTKADFPHPCLIQCALAEGFEVGWAVGEVHHRMGREVGGNVRTAPTGSKQAVLCKELENPLENTLLRDST